MFNPKNGIDYTQPGILYSFYVGLRVLGKKGTAVEGLIGTIISIDDSDTNILKLAVSFILPANKSNVSLIRSRLHIPDNIGTASFLSSIIVNTNDVYSLEYIIGKASKEYHMLYKRYKLTTGDDKKKSIYDSLTSHSATLEQITNACIFTGYVDYSKIDNEII